MAKSSNNVLAIGVGLNLDPLNNDIQQAASTAKSGMDTIGSAIVGSSSKSGTATKDLGDKVQSMRAQLRQATQDAQQMAEKFGVMSTQAIASASRAGELKDKIGDINTVITAFSADSKFTVVAGALQQAAGAASIVTGAMGLLGTESKATQEMLLKVQSALALTQGLAQIKEMGAAFTALQAVIAGQVIPSITAMGISMNMALGIFGLAAIAITALVIDYNTVSDATENWRAELEKTIRTQALQLQLFQTWKDISSRGLNERNQALQAENAIYEKNKNDLIQQLVTVEREEIASGGRRSFARTIVNEAIKDNYRIHQEQLQKINDEFNQKELDKADKHQKELDKLKVNKISNKLPTISNNRPLLQPQMQPSFKGAKVFDIDIEAEMALMIQGMDHASIKLQEVNKNMWAKIAQIKENGLNSVFGNLGEALGSTMAKSIQGQNVDMFGALRDAVLLSIADMAVAVGSALVAAGVALAIDPTTSAMTGAYTKIAAGTALIAAGSLAKGLIKGGSSGSSTSQPTSVAQSSFSQGGNMSSNFAPTQGNEIVINGMIKGNDIQLVNGRNDKKFNRNFNFG